MSPPPTLAVAVVGCGQIADAHLSTIRNIPGTRVVAVCDHYPDLARQAAERFRVPGVYSDFERMLERARPDVVHITTPPHTHAFLTCQALAVGAHVYVEKPFTIDAAEADRVFRARAPRAGWYVRGTINSSIRVGPNAGSELRVATSAAWCTWTR